MSFYEFKKTDSLFNIIKAHPKVEFFIYNSSIFYQNKNAFSGSFVSNLFGVPTGFTPLTEINVDRKVQSTGRIIGPSSSVDPLTNVVDNGTIYPFLIKNNGNSFKTTTDEDYAITTPGSVMTSSYFLSSSISRRYISSTYNTNYQNHNTNKVIPQPALADPASYISNISASVLNTLYNTLNEYTIYSPHFAVSSSIYSWNKLEQNVNLIQIPGTFFGSKIKKGTVQLDYYITGTLVARLTDSSENGTLVQQSGTISSNDGKIAGVVLYKHGFILLTGSWSLDNNTISYDSTDNSKWIYWGIGANDGTSADTISSTSTRMSASFSISFQGTNKIPNYTFFATAPKGDLNWSNNPTFLNRTTYKVTGSGFTSGSYLVTQTPRTIYNIVSSSIPTYSASFENTTYINHVNLYDQYGNLIGVAKTSKPIKKTEDTDFTFKLKLDM